MTCKSCPKMPLLVEINESSTSFISIFLSRIERDTALLTGQKPYKLGVLNHTAAKPCC